MKAAFFDSKNLSFFKNSILIIDRDGLIGGPLSLKLSKEFFVVFVSRRSVGRDMEKSNIIYVPFSGKFPEIPDSKYSQIIFIDEEGQDLEFLPRIISKARSVNSNFIFAQGLSAKGEYAISEVLKLYHSAKVVLFGDIFDKELILKKENFKSVINRFIYQAHKFGRMQILGNGLRETYPVFLQDVVEGLMGLVFGAQKSQSLFYIFPKHPPTELSLVHMIQKNNPEIIVDFTKHDPRSGVMIYPSNGENLLDDKYPLAKKIRGIDIKKKVKAQDESPHGSSMRLKKFPFFMLWILIFLLFFPFIFTSLFSSFGLNTLYYAKRELDRGNFIHAKSSFHLSQTFFYLGQQTSSILSLQAKIVGRENNLKRLLQDLDLGYKLSQGLYQALNSEIYFSKILTGKSENPRNDLTLGENYLKSSIVALNKIKAEGKIPAPILQSLETINPLVKLLFNTSDIMPSILGMEGPKTYLILFQNNMELRPGGGIIGSYGILKFNMGKITEFTIHDVYDADKQLRGHVEPPFAIRRYLLQQHWYMRDSNFDVDFVKSALSSSNFLFVETGQKTDGVIAIDMSFIKNILHAIGPVYVTDYKENVDENNLYMRTQFYTAKNFFPGSTQKKDFLRALNEEIVTKITKEKVPYLLVAQSISDALSQKHLMFVMNNNFQKIFTVNGWSSSLWDERKNSEDIVNDFVGINEANLGVNKANYYISRQVSQKVKIEDNGNISEELIVNYKNESKGWPGGDYKNYLRIILPKNTSLSGITINDKDK
ncbi:MAG: DUF4012 domain-containing protein, partial [Candidatus Levybacteria bacterium]|nr:DUF4012 domain-containing protein [Candidatus Levybacteria bacterium]